MKSPVKLLICYIFAVVALFVIVNIRGIQRNEEQLLTEKKTEYIEIAEELSDIVTDSLYDQDRNIQNVRNDLVNTSRLIRERIMLINVKGELVVDTADKKGLPFTNISGIGQELLDNTVTEHTVIPGVSEEAVVFISIPLMFNYQAKGFICIIIPHSEIHNEAITYMETVNACMLWGVGILAVVFLIIYYFTVLPIRKIRTAAVAYSKGNYDYKMKVRTHDEFRELADTLEFMVERLADNEERQKRFVANISHDFRSPLTSIKGYAEAIKDGTIPYENKDKYLDVILFEADRLHKLTTNILELNTMDNKGVILNIKSFDITSVIRVIADSFEGSCRKKRISIRLLFDDSEIYVDGDVERIEQVIYNLVDNAIKFSNTDSEILIEVKIKGGKALVRVKDSGCGISKDSISKIWDRFYKSDESRGKDKKGTGLGLSIVKEIIQAHDENINVISTPGVGTEFTFTLRIS